MNRKFVHRSNSILRMRLFLLLVSFLLLPFYGWTQARFVAETDIVKVGEVKFQTPEKVVFTFTNKGDKDLKIVRVKPACACTTVDYTQQPVAPGEKGQVEVTFDAALLGTFYKEVEVYLEEEAEPHYLAMQGSVVKEVKDFSREYPIDLGNVRLNTNYILFENVNKGTKPTQEIRLVNTEHTAYRPEIMHLPDYLTAESDPENVPAGKPGVVRLTLKSDELYRYGLTETSIYLARYLGDKVCDANEIKVQCVLVPDFSGLTDEQRAIAPHIEFASNQLELGEWNAKGKQKMELLLRNTGKTPLTIHHVQVFHNALNVSLGHKVLKPGKISKLKVEVSQQALKNGKGQPRILLVSDDPENPISYVNIILKENGTSRE